ncbi:hypothetical protein O6H91_05G050700 [Diphasiastrum complanatum]|uniref:Uncharacterized protein n=6 Tax=Diphasiastrum complanatum TaxID=34168 RepID=A0ACC2DNH2_DIPCM|nr:hypothetical protein O6H91_05G050700 [Diphasiastrum complanatum]KAJ7555686.1 hypothetical protein O6H91_05G050700 [Diphasiastrum complanatum]KAJ7555687.1 hypothetical protein O6H91_05G050700 [Diphasiastrum complanatum]KAJ7555688.1 hypothetical protein O6H91_05G050700 [Diphasiastrum complanatum]KAJ7555690.1 hypothetical protein O6H91_05G050700 [Diphasiastrum complanatum]
MDNAKETKRGWQANVRAMRDRIKGRLRISGANRIFRQSQRRGAARNVALRATATGLVVARVFKGNVVLARVVQSVAKEEWAGKVKRISSLFPNFRTILATSLAGGAVLSKQPVHAEALATCTGMEGYEAVAAGFEKHTPLKEILAEQAEESQVFRILQKVAVPFLGNVCYVFMHGLNRTEVYGAEKLQNAILKRSSCQGLVTVSNHVASMDDPLVLSSLLSPRLLADATSLRWTLCATDRCFTSATTSAFFRAVKVLPLARGQGIYQQGLDMALGKLNRGDWVHIFPEGSRSRNGGKTIESAKRGVGRLIYDAENTPLVVPFVHTGMQEVMPIGSKFPAIGKKVVVLVGDPINMDDLVKQDSFSKVAAYDAIAFRVGQSLQCLKNDLDNLVNHTEDKQQKMLATKNAEEFWQYVDWEAQGFMRSEVGVCAFEHKKLGGQSCAVPFQQVHHTMSATKITVTANAEEVVRGTGDDLGQALDDTESENTEGDYQFLDDSILQGSLTARLQDFSNPAALVGFAARGWLLSSKYLFGENSFTCQRGSRTWCRKGSWSTSPNVPANISWKSNVETFRNCFFKHLSSKM